MYPYDPMTMYARRPVPVFRPQMQRQQPVFRPQNGLAQLGQGSYAPPESPPMAQSGYLPNEQGPMPGMPPPTWGGWGNPPLQNQPGANFGQSMTNGLGMPGWGAGPGWRPGFMPTRSMF